MCTIINTLKEEVMMKNNIEEKDKIIESDILSIAHILNNYYRKNNMPEKTITVEEVWDIIDRFKQDGIIKE